jgi:hypothetical protein
MVQETQEGLQGDVRTDVGTVLLMLVYWADTWVGCCKEHGGALVGSSDGVTMEENSGLW